MTKISDLPEMARAIIDTDRLEASRDDSGTWSSRHTAFTRIKTWILAFTELMQGANNLSDVANAATARTNIGAGTGDGDMLGSNNLSDVANATTARTNIGAGTGNGDMLGANNLSEITNDATARANIGAGVGDITGGANAGAGQGNVFRNETSGVLNFRSLVQGSNVTITQQADTVTIAAAGGGGGAVDSVFGRTGDVVALVGDYSSFYAPLVHTHAAADVISGTFANARIAEGNVTQHEAAVNHNALANFSNNQHVPTAVGGFIDGGGSDIANNTFGYTDCPIDGTITVARLRAGQSGTVTVTVAKASLANFPTFTTLGTVALSAADKIDDTTLAGWTTDVSAGDTIRFTVSGNTGVQELGFSIGVDKT